MSYEDGLLKLPELGYDTITLMVEQSLVFLAWKLLDEAFVNALELFRHFATLMRFDVVTHLAPQSQVEGHVEDAETIDKSVTPGEEYFCVCSIVRQSPLHFLDNKKRKAAEMDPNHQPDVFVKLVVHLFVNFRALTFYALHVEGVDKSRIETHEDLDGRRAAHELQHGERVVEPH